MVRWPIQEPPRIRARRREVTTSQRIAMQNDPHVPFLSFGLSSLKLEPLEDEFHRTRAHARAAARRSTASPGTTQHAEAGAPPVCPTSLTELYEECVDHGDPLLDGAELLRAAREPVEWLLTLAQRLSAGDSEELAAVDRLRAAFHARLAGRVIGVRMSDVLIVFALLVGALDLTIVQEGITRSIADGVGTLITCEGMSIATQLARIATSRPTANQARMPRRRRDRSPGSTPL
jgi:hypothetical protein